MGACSDGQDSHHSSLTPDPYCQFKKNVPEYSSFRIMKQKVFMPFRENNSQFYKLLPHSCDNMVD